MDQADLINLLLRVKNRAGMFGLRRHGEVVTLLYGIDLGCGLLPNREIYEWMMDMENPAYGGRGGAGWQYRVANTCIVGYWDRGGTLGIFTAEEEDVTRDGILGSAIAWLRRHEG